MPAQESMAPLNAGRWLARALPVLALSSVTLPVGAQVADYPYKPVRIVVVYGAGGGLDIVTRILADPLSKSLGRQVVVENRPGAGGNIGTEYMAKQPPDGYTLMVTTNSHQINSLIYRNPGYDPKRDFVPVIQFTGAASVIVTHRQSAFLTLKDLVSKARAQPGAIGFGTAGNGSPTHIAMEIFKSFAKLDLVHIPYKTAAHANSDAAAGQIPVSMAALPPTAPMIQAGLLRALAITTEKRFTGLPNVPTIAESGFPGYSHVTWIGMFAVAGTPQAIVARLNKEIGAILATPAILERLMGLGAEPVGRSATEFEAVLAADYETTAKVVKRIGLKAD
jgi:tripartite-type tricarboxylate transporter receptor subunit TctC